MLEKVFRLQEGKMQLDNVSIATGILTDIGFSWLSDYIGKMLNKSTKNNFGALQVLYKQASH